MRGSDFGKLNDTTASEKFMTIDDQINIVLEKHRN